MFRIAGIAARFRRIHSRLDRSRQGSPFYFDFMVEIAVEFVSNSFERVDEAGFVFDDDVVPALTLETTANRGNVANRRGAAPPDAGGLEDCCATAPSVPSRKMFSAIKL